MDKEATELYNAEMERLELQQKGFRDAYNTETLNQNLHDYIRIANSDSTLAYAYKGGQTLGEYLTLLQIHVDLAKTKNWKVHVLIGSHGHPWYTHRHDCFMCADNAMISYLLNLLKIIDKLQPDIKL